eukprot:2126-Heterococcus_DN1.PRE.1
MQWLTLCMHLVFALLSFTSQRDEIALLSAQLLRQASFETAAQADSDSDSEIDEYISSLSSTATAASTAATAVNSTAAAASSNATNSSVTTDPLLPTTCAVM